MPYSPDHKDKTRERIVESARRLFNRRGFNDVSIDEIMEGAGLTRGGFYHHFATKDELYAEAVTAVLSSHSMHDSGGPCSSAQEIAKRIVQSYLSRTHLDNIDTGCPLVALPSDVARSGPAVRAAYRKVLQSLAGLLTTGMPVSDKTCTVVSNPSKRGEIHREALALIALCVGGLVLARAVDEDELSDDIREAALSLALKTGGWTDID